MIMLRIKLFIGLALFLTILLVYTNLFVQNQLHDEKNYKILDNSESDTFNSVYMKDVFLPREKRFELLTANKSNNYTNDIYSTEHFKSYTFDDNLKTILLYTPVLQNYTNWIDWYFGSDVSPLKCRNGVQCHVTTNQSRIQKADAVVVSLQDLPEHPSMWLPQDYTPTPDQKWIGFWQEAPTSPWFRFNETDQIIKLGALDGIFDWTISYRSDADIKADYQKSCFYQKRKTSEYNQNNINEKLILNVKDKSALWVVSHCNTTSEREKYVDGMSAHINITTYGRCYSQDENYNKDAFKELDSYYFYLSFENSLCDEYITEKFWNILRSNTVPVVMGAPREDFEKLAPPKSFIHISDFNSSTELAEYLIYLQQNPDKYLEYLSWKNDYELICKEAWPCQLCNRLYDNQMDGQDLDNNQNQNQSGQIQDFWKFWNQRKCYGNNYFYNSTSTY